MTKLTLAQASIIADTALSFGRSKNMTPLTVVVIDETGGLKTVKKEDECGLLRFDIAFGKAYGALGMGRSSRTLGKMAEERPAFINAAVGASGGRLIPVPGGVLIKSKEGLIIGAVGVSGDTSDNDEACGVAGIEKAGLTAEV
ncbi:MAG TPA: heme-binding protein [Alphaproteobacteria bacterium]|jgi:uncharacterized protein GlcG (DUF336 family)